MKKLIIQLFLVSYSMLASAQEKPQQIMEKRAKEFHRIISLNDREVWRSFITENYSEAFINKPSSRKVVVAGEGKEMQPARTETDKIEGKLELMEMLHQDFGGSTLGKLTYSDYQVVMVLTSTEGLRGTFKITYTKEKPYLIDNLGVEASMER
jgi:hypothetical protein